MNGIKYLLDTCFILGLYNAHPEAIKYMNGVNSKDCAVSIINEIEILGYAHLDVDDEIELKALLSHLTILSIHSIVKEKTIELRKRYKIKLPDAIVLATALSYNLKLLSLDDGLMNKYYKEIAS